jgi:predicted metal-dependent hydrolase
MRTFEKHGKILPYNITYKAIKNTYFRVQEGTLYITTNPYVKELVIHSFINQKFDKFYHKASNQKRLEPADHIELWGRPYQIIMTKGKFKYHMDEKNIYLETQMKDIESIKKKMYHLELEKMLHRLLPQIHLVLAKKSIYPLPIRLKYLKSKFGSYHRKNKEITLNTFLARLNPIYLTYVIYHEYAHVKVFNHSKDFYNLLSELMPNHKLYQKDLKKMAII